MEDDEISCEEMKKYWRKGEEMGGDERMCKDRRGKKRRWEERRRCGWRQEDLVRDTRSGRK